MSDTQKTVLEYLQLVKSTLDKLDGDQLEKAIDAFMRAYHERKTIFVFGNGVF